MSNNKHNLLVRADKRERIKLVDANRTSDAETEIELVHKNGFIVLAIGEPTGKDRYNWHQWGYKKEQITNVLLQNILGYNYNTYLSLNSFKSPRKTISNLYSLNALWSDIDYYKVPKYKNKTHDEMITIISKNKLIKKIPPSLWIYSGRGIYPVWLIEDAYAKACLPIWNKLMDAIHQELVRYGADPSATEASHVLRLAGSNNTKTNNKSKLVKDIFNFNPKRYTLTQLSDEILYELKYTKEEWALILKKKKKNKKEKKACVVKSLYNIHSLNYARMQDIEKLIELRDGKCKGTRELMIFLYRYWANCYHKSDETALQEALEINAMFNEPLSETEVIKATKNAADAAELWELKLNEYYALEKKPLVKKFFYEDKSGAYVYSNKKLISLLNVTQEEMRELLTIFNYEEKLRRKNEKRRADRRNENGLTSREQSKMDRIYVILELESKGLNQSKIAKEIGISRQAVSKLVKEIKAKNITKVVENNVIEMPEFSRVTDTELKLIIV